ncbi:glycosyltransferase family 2 protein [Pseudoalteromonas espejiana]
MGQDKSLVSIIMPAHNVAEYISESIKSVLKQTYLDWELILVDDCSTDETINVITPFLEDIRIQLIVNEANLGGAGSRNVAIKHARGQYIAFLDSDDLWTADKLEKQIDFMQKTMLAFHLLHTLISTRMVMFLKQLTYLKKLTLKHCLSITISVV